MNDKIGIILPELMARNSKLGVRLNSKLKVSNFLNITENHNHKYLKSFVLHSDKRVKDIKTGLKLLKAINQSSKNLSPLCSKISNDIILQNSDFLIEEKKLLNENTEQETHIKINDLIQNLKNIVKNSNLHPNKSSKNSIKSLSEDRFQDIKNYVNNKIKNENNMINNKIQGYLEKLKNSAQTNKKEFRNYVDNINISDNIKFINYSKPKPLKIKDKECSSIIKIKNKIFPYLKSSFRKNKVGKKKIINMKKNWNKKINLNISNETNNMYNEKDTVKLINSLAENGRNLPLKISNSVNKVNSLIDINLPMPKDYEQIIKDTKKNAQILNISHKSNFHDINGNIKDIEKILNTPEDNFLSKNKLQKIINIFKKEIDIIKIDNFNFVENKDKNNKAKYDIINTLNKQLIRNKKFNQRDLNDFNENNKNISETDLIKIKIPKNKKNNNNNNKEKSIIFQVPKDNNSFTMERNIEYRRILNYKAKSMNNKTFNKHYDSNIISFQNSFPINEAKNKNL